VIAAAVTRTSRDLVDFGAKFFFPWTFLPPLSIYIYFFGYPGHAGNCFPRPLAAGDVMKLGGPRPDLRYYISQAAHCAKQLSSDESPASEHKNEDEEEELEKRATIIEELQAKYAALSRKHNALLKSLEETE
jgi:hypothetical protein